MTRKISMTLEDGEDTSDDEVRERFLESVDDPFKDDIEITNVVGENPEAAPAHLEFETDADPEAMVLEAEYMANSEFERASATVTPTDEEIEEAMEEEVTIPKIENVPESLPAHDSEEERIEAENNCDHPDGRLVRDESAPVPGAMVMCLDCGAGI